VEREYLPAGVEGLAWREGGAVLGLVTWAVEGERAEIDRGVSLAQEIEVGGQRGLRVTAADEQERAQVGAVAADVQTVTGETVELAYVDQGYTGEDPATAAAAHGMQLEVIKLPEAKRGFVLLPRRWVVERTFAWTARFRRLARDYERLPETLAGLHFIAIAGLMLQRVASIFISA